MPELALILGGSRWQVDIIRTISNLGLRTLVADISADAPGRQFADEFIQIDTNDIHGLLQIARRRKVNLVIAEQTDRVVPVAAFLNEQLGLIGIRPATARLFTNKYAMRKALVDAGVPMPRYREISELGEARAAVSQWGFPVVLKPKKLQSSVGVYKVNTDDQLLLRLADCIKAANEASVLIEEYVDGTEITIEGFSIKGHCRALAISEKEHYSFNPCVARRLVYPPRLSAEEIARIEIVGERVVDTLGLQDGISHAEYRMREGLPYLVEVAARGGGNRVASVIIKHVSGVDVYPMLIRRLQGGEVEMPESQERAANLEFLHFPSGRVKTIRGIDEVWATGLVSHIELEFGIGDTIKDPSDDRSRQGYFISLADTRDEVDEKARRVKEIVRVEY